MRIARTLTTVPGGGGGGVGGVGVVQRGWYRRWGEVLSRTEVLSGGEVDDLSPWPGDFATRAVIT